jgi:peptidoglycan hydrolase CwlO-like protein
MVEDRHTKDHPATKADVVNALKSILLSVKKSTVGMVETEFKKLTSTIGRLLTLVRELHKRVTTLEKETINVHLKLRELEKRIDELEYDQQLN